MFATLPDGALDIVGDVHGELAALEALLSHMGYDVNGAHPGRRSLVFVGDLCDRGPDSPGVVSLVRRVVENGRGVAILGNHELNLLRRLRKDGNDWFWNEKSARDQKYEPTTKPAPYEQDALLDFLSGLPLTLERHDLRVVHAAWHEPALAALQGRTSTELLHLYETYELAAKDIVQRQGLGDKAKAEEAEWAHALADLNCQVPLLHAVAEVDEIKQMANPIKVLTSGVERKGVTPFFSSGKWRFAERVRWWDEYTHEKPVVVGHYWRRIQPVDRMKVGKGDPDLFEGLPSTAWHGQRGNVFCVDYSVGGRFRERLEGQSGQTTKLAALRWPERELVLDTGEVLSTAGYRVA